VDETAGRRRSLVNDSPHTRRRPEEDDHDGLWHRRMRSGPPVAQLWSTDVRPKKTKKWRPGKVAHKTNPCRRRNAANTHRHFVGIYLVERYSFLVLLIETQPLYCCRVRAFPLKSNSRE